MPIVASFSLKGGVGKTTTAVNLAFASALSGRNTLLVDLDAQGAASYYFRIRADRRLRGGRFFTSKKRLLNAIRATDYERLDLLPAHRSFRNFDLILHRFKRPEKRLRQVLRRLRKEYDLVVLDCPPNGSLLSEGICAAADVILVPMIPTTLCGRTSEQLSEMFESCGLSTKRLRPFFSMVRHDDAAHQQMMTAFRARVPNMMTAAIPYSAEIENMGIRREPVLCYAENDATIAAYQSLCDEAWRERAA